MIELYATTHLSIPLNVSPDVSGRPRQECRRGDVYLMVSGAERPGNCFFDSPDFTLVCRTDLLGSSGAVAEQLARLYSQQGDDFVVGLRGSFAIIIYDYNLRTLKAWTDHFAIERLVFTEVGDALTIATDIRLLLAVSDHRPAIDRATILEYLQYACIPTPRTIYDGVSKLAPGHRLTSSPRGATHSYWDIEYDAGRRREQSESAWADNTRAAVRSAVASNVQDFTKGSNLGCFLSGGTDSSSVAGLIGQVTGNGPRTFSIGFDDPRYNEIQYARVAAKKFSADHHEYFVKPDDILALIHKAVDAYDEPFGNSSIVPTYYCSRLAAESGVTHLLAGDGGDELFGGNARYVDDRIFQHYGLIPRWIRRALIEPAVSFGAERTALSRFKQAASYIRRSNLPAPDRYFSYSLVSSIPGGDLFTPDFLEDVEGYDSLNVARNHFRSARADHDLNRWLYLDLKIIIADNDVRKVTTMSRLAGVTARYPLLYPELVEFTTTIPPDLKVRNARLRYLFKKAMQDLLPGEIITKSKHGFGLPYSVWLGDNKGLRDFTFDVLGSTKCRQRGYFRNDLLDWIWPQYESVHRGYYGEILWLLLMLELWHVTQWDNRLTEPKLIERVPSASTN